MTDTSDYSRRTENEIRHSHMKDLHEIERHYDVVNNAIALISTHTKPHHHWVLKRLESVRDRAIKAEMLLAHLSSAEAVYRYVHDSDSDGVLATGRAWHNMRRSGDEARSFLETED